MSTIRAALLLICLLASCATKPPPAPACPPAPQPGGDLMIVASARDHAATVASLIVAIEGRGLKVVHQIDHAAAATAAGFELPATTVLVFGNPKVGTPLIQSAPSIALDLPLRMLVRQIGTRVEVVYRKPATLAAAHGVGDHPAVAKIAEALAAITADGTRP